MTATIAEEEVLADLDFEASPENRPAKRCQFAMVTGEGESPSTAKIISIHPCTRQAHWLIATRCPAGEPEDAYACHEHKRLALEMPDKLWCAWHSAVRVITAVTSLGGA